jgi:hypothetical protein
MVFDYVAHKNLVHSLNYDVTKSTSKLVCYKNL